VTRHVKRGGLSVACVVILLTMAPRVLAQQAPSLAPLPPAHRGGEIERAITVQDWARAESLLVPAIERAPQESQLLKVLGGVFLLQRKPLNAAIAFKKAEAIAPLDDGARFSLVLSYIALNRGDWARPELERLVASEPSNPTYEYWLGRLDYDGGHYASAIQRFERVVARDPSFVRAYDNLGLCYEAQNEPEQALRYYEKAVELNRAAATPSPWPPMNFGVLLRTRGALQDAETLLREALSYDEDLAQARHELGLTLEQSNRTDDAIAALRRAVEQDPTYAAPYYALARIYRRQGRAEESREAMVAFERLHEVQREAKGR
jgi:tetratricopeptide (TPR) repeat protein